MIARDDLRNDKIEGAGRVSRRAERSPKRYRMEWSIFCCSSWPLTTYRVRWSRGLNGARLSAGARRDSRVYLSRSGKLCREGWHERRVIE